jgi:predicted RNA binding protein YcfA (HicA-like mRNA interferase family)
MTQADKRLKKMRQNPRDWRIEDIQTVADRHGIEWDHDGGSHVIFRSPYGEHISIPAHRPIKPIYITKFLELVDSVQETNDDHREEQI